jgi:hypothetical protein
VEIFFRENRVTAYICLPHFIKKIIVMALATFLYHFTEKKMTAFLKIKLKLKFPIPNGTNKNTIVILNLL